MNNFISSTQLKNWIFKQDDIEKNQKSKFDRGLRIVSDINKSIDEYNKKLEKLPNEYNDKSIEEININTNKLQPRIPLSISSKLIFKIKKL